MPDKINIDEKFAKFSEHWRPKIVAELNGQEFKLAKIKGEYPFHAHEHDCLLYTSPSPRDRTRSRMPSSA